MTNKKNIDDLDNPTLLHIFSYLKPNDLAQVSKTSRRMHSLANDHTLWRPFFLELSSYTPSSSQSNRRNYKAEYARIMILKNMTFRQKIRWHYYQNYRDAKLLFQTPCLHNELFKRIGGYGACETIFTKYPKLILVAFSNASARKFLINHSAFRGFLLSFSEEKNTAKYIRYLLTENIIKIHDRELLYTLKYNFKTSCKQNTELIPVTKTIKL